MVTSALKGSWVDDRARIRILGGGTIRDLMRILNNIRQAFELKFGYRLTFEL